MKPVWIIITTVLVTAVVVGAGAFAYIKYKPTSEVVGETKNDVVSSDNTVANDTTTAPTDTNVPETTKLKTYQLTLTNSSIKHPADFQVVPRANTDPVSSLQRSDYEVKSSDGKSWGFIGEYNIPQWLNGPSADEGYVLDKTKRAELLTIFQQIYSERQVSLINMQKLSNYYEEFLTYSPKDRIYIDYVESQDGQSRGIAMVNTRGQDVGLGASYSVALYNKDHNAVVSTYVALKGSEIDKLNAKFGDYKPQEVAQINDEIHQTFTTLILNTPRKQLSFGSTMDLADQIVKTWSF